MVDILQEYKTKYMETDDTDFETPTKELAEAWLDAKIDVLKHLSRIGKEQDYNLVWGDYDDGHGDFANEVKVCSIGNRRFDGVHICSGIKSLADILGKELTKTRRSYDDGDYPWEYSFDYKGVRVYQIAHADSTSRLGGKNEKTAI